MSSSTAVVTAAATCLNCGHELQGPYCSSCGQKSLSFTLDLHHFFHEVTHEFLHLDGKVFKTIRLLITKPGLLTREFVEGKRARYISPLRLYLTMSLVFFSLLLMFGTATKAKYTIRHSEQTAGSDTSITSEMEQRLQKGADKAAREPEKMGEIFVHSWPKAMFLLMPLFAALVMLFYRRAQPFYVPHLYFAVHYHAFVFALLSVTLALSKLKIPWIDPITFLADFAIVPYLLVALRTVYGGSWKGTIIKGAAITLVYFFCFIAATLGVVFLTLLRL